MNEMAFISALRQIKLPAGELLEDGTTYYLDSDDLKKLDYINDLNYYTNFGFGEYYNVDVRSHNIVNQPGLLVLTVKPNFVIGGIIVNDPFDIMAQMLPEWDSMHFMSTIHKNGILKKFLDDNQIITIDKKMIKNNNDLEKKEYLLSYLDMRPIDDYEKNYAKEHCTLDLKANPYVYIRESGYYKMFGHHKRNKENH